MKKIFHLLLVLTCATWFSSCLNEDPLFNPDDAENIVEFFDIGAIASPAGAVHPLFVSSFKAEPSVDFKVIISYSGPHSNDSDIEVQVAVSQTALDAYNQEQGSHYEVLPANLYTVPSLNVVIPRGETKAELVFALKTENFDFSKAYALPLRIVGSSKGTISTNFGTAIYAVVAKNKFDGVFEVTGTMVDALNAFRGYYPTTVELRTLDANTVTRYDRNLDTNLHGIIQISSGGLFVFGNFSIQFDLAPDGTLTAARNTIFDPAPRSRGGKLGTGVNKMTFKPDGTPDKMEVVYIMTQSGADRATFTETWTYVGPRN